MTGRQLYERARELNAIFRMRRPFEELMDSEQAMWNQLAQEASAVSVATEVGATMHRERFGF